MQLPFAGLGLHDAPPKREITAWYDDPLAMIWRGCAAELGWTVQRSGEVYASWDGRGTLMISDPAGMDADDSVAQLILHEICHALVAGEAGLRAQDWGLENTDNRDLAYEFACHRVQAALADRVGLRAFFAPTTDWRPYYDALGADPLAGDDEPAIGLARAGLARAAAPPWVDALQAALDRTARVVAVVRELRPHGSTFAAAP